ncbi:hypothetical protein F52700_10550 [Fusarium sp. NRRL 52700]|nr:hypothetical protein F52700_10550 [Fusarium sp. NRRL 52700]
MELGQCSRRDLQVIIRLQVWHYSQRGRCPEYNCGLARLFTPAALGGLKHWIPIPTEVVEPDDISIRDEYVPVEVDFVHHVATYDNPRGNPESGARDIFAKFAPPIVYNYFVSEIQSPPHAMNIYAIAKDEEITDIHIKMKYAHSFFFIPLELRLQRFIKPALVRQEDTITEILQAGVDSLPLLASLIFAYMSFQGAKAPKDTDILATSKSILSQHSDRLPWLKDMLDKAGNMDEDGSKSEDKTTSSDPLILLGDASNSFQELRKLAAGLKPRLEKVTSNEGLTNQGIIRTIQDLREATIHLSKYELAMRSFNEEEFEKWNKKANHHGKWYKSAGILTLGLVVAAAVAFWNPNLASKLATTFADLKPIYQGAVGSSVTSVPLTTGYHYWENSKALDKLGDVKDRASAGRIALEGVLVALRQTQAILALVYIVQAMRLPIECMGDEELERAVKMLGGDIQYLHNPTYSQTLIQDRLANLVDASIQLDREYQRTMDAMNVVMDTVGRIVETE